MDSLTACVLPLSDVECTLHTCPEATCLFYRPKSIVSRYFESKEAQEGTKGETCNFIKLLVNITVRIREYRGSIILIRGAGAGDN